MQPEAQGLSVMPFLQAVPSIHWSFRGYMQMVTNSGCIGTGSCMWSCGYPRHALVPGTDILTGGSSGVGWVPGEGRREEGLGNGAPPILAFGNTTPKCRGRAEVRLGSCGSSKGHCERVGEGGWQRPERGQGMPDLVCVKIILAKGWVVSRDVQR